MISGPRFDQTKKIIPYSVVGDIEIFEEARKSCRAKIFTNLFIKEGADNKLSKGPSFLMKYGSKEFNNTNNDERKKNPNYDFINDKEIDQYYSEIKTKIEKNNLIKSANNKIRANTSNINIIANEIPNLNDRNTHDKNDTNKLRLNNINKITKTFKIIEKNKMTKEKLVRQSRERNQLYAEINIDKKDNKGKNSVDANSDIQSNIDNSSEIPLHVKKCLDRQENILSNKLNKENYYENLTNRLMKMSKKKSEDLLIKKMDYSKIRKELDELKSPNSPSVGDIPPYGNWIKNLRSSKDKVFPATTYLNFGEGSNSYYVPVREKKEKCIEILRDPNSSSKIDSKLLMGNINKKIFDPNFSDNKSYNSSAVNFMKSITNTSTAFDLNSTLKKNLTLSNGSFTLINGSSNLLVNFYLSSYYFYIIL